MTPGLRRRLLGLRAPVAALTAGLFLDGLFHFFSFALALRLWLVGVAALVAAVFVRAAVAQYDPLFIPRPSLRRSNVPARVRPADLAEVERAVQFSTWSGFDVRLRLAPVLRQIANQRLAGRRGINLDLHAAQAEAVLGTETWSLIQTDTPLPAREAPGLTARQVRAVVEALEAI